jgi:hypothetical protein
MLPIDLLSRSFCPRPGFGIKEALFVGKLLLRSVLPNRLNSDRVVRADILFINICRPELLLLSIGDVLPMSCGGRLRTVFLVLSRFGALFDHIALLFGAGLSIVICPRSRWWHVLGPHVFPFTPSAGTEIQQQPTLPSMFYTGVWMCLLFRDGGFVRFVSGCSLHGMRRDAARTVSDDEIFNDDCRRGELLCLSDDT